MSVHVVCSAAEALELIKSGENYDLFLFDLNLPVISGLELTKRMIAINSDVVILIYTGYEIAPNYNLLIEAGVSGFISKTASKEQLINALRCALRGEAVLPIILLKQLRRNEMRIPAEHNGKNIEEVSINQKEQSILQEVANGKSNKEIANMLFMSQRTVEYNLTRIFEKLNVRSRSEAIAEAKKAGLIRTNDF